MKQTTTQLVEQMLRDRPATRNDDRVLIIAVFESLGLELTDSQVKKFHDMPSTETIRRVRQSIQSKGKYQASENVQQYREVKSQEMTQSSPQASPQRLEGILEDKNYKNAKHSKPFDPWANS